jgi:gamma-glutamylcysteine synthetase
VTERFGQQVDLPTTGETNMTKTKIALATALILGTASAALANDIETNPSTAQSTREWRDFLNQNAGNAYGYVAPKKAHRATQTQDR